MRSDLDLTTIVSCNGIISTVPLLSWHSAVVVNSYMHMHVCIEL